MRHNAPNRRKVPAHGGCASKSIAPSLCRSNVSKSWLVVEEPEGFAVYHQFVEGAATTFEIQSEILLS